VQAYNEAQLKENLANIQGWQLNPANGEIYREYQFGNFVEALTFVNKVGEIAEELGHHPDITIRYNKVLLSVITHDAGGLTEKDFTLAQRANAL